MLFLAYLYRSLQSLYENLLSVGPCCQSLDGPDVTDVTCGKQQKNNLD